MIKEVDILGVYVAPIVAYLIGAFIVFVPVRLWFDRIEIHRWFWHRPLLDFAVFLIILSTITLIFLS